jgi:hypothetical protein
MVRIGPPFVTVFNDPLSIVVGLIRIVMQRFGLLQFRAQF